MDDKNNYRFYDLLGPDYDGSAARKRAPEVQRSAGNSGDGRQALSHEEMYANGLQAIKIVAIGLAVIVLLSIALVPNLYYRNKINEIGYEISTVKAGITTAQTRTAKLNNQIRSKFTISTIDEFAVSNGMIPSARYTAEYVSFDSTNEIVLAENGQ